VQRERFKRLLTESVYKLAWRYALRMSSTPEDAEDLLQESLVQALLKLPALRDDSSFKPWLLTIVRRKALDRARITKRHRQTKQFLPVLAAEPTDILSAEILKVLQALPDNSRELLCLFYLEGLSAKEVAHVLRISEAAVRQRLVRARLAMRRELSRSPGVHYYYREVRGE